MPAVRRKPAYHPRRRRPARTPRAVTRQLQPRCSARRRTRRRLLPRSASISASVPLALWPWALCPHLCPHANGQRHHALRERILSARREHCHRVPRPQRASVRALPLAHCHNPCQPLRARMKDRFYRHRFRATQCRLCHPHIYPPCSVERLRATSRPSVNTIRPSLSMNRLSAAWRFQPTRSSD
eukprot:3981359-Pleurochrysis_carterae.AAC.1